MLRERRQDPSVAHMVDHTAGHRFRPSEDEVTISIHSHLFDRPAGVEGQDLDHRGVGPGSSARPGGTEVTR